MLEGAKLPGVYERKRKHLMEKLLDLQDDTRRDQPPKFEDDRESLTSMDSPQKKSLTEETDEAKSSSEGASKSKVAGAASKFEVKPAPSKFKYRTLEELKELKRRRESGLPEETEPPKETTEEKNEETNKSESIKVEKTDNVSLPEEDDDNLYDDTVGFQPASQQQQQQQEEEQKHETEEADAKKARANSKTGTGLMKRLFNKKEKKGHISESVSSETLDEIENGNGSNKADATSCEEIAPEEEDEPEGFNLTSQLEKVTKGRFGKYHYTNYKAVLKDDQVTLTRPKDKEPTIISLVGAATVVRDPYQFELHTEDDKSFTFRTDSEDLTIKWVETLKAAIDACTPVEPIEEEPEEEEEEGIGIL